MNFLSLKKELPSCFFLVASENKSVSERLRSTNPSDLRSATYRTSIVNTTDAFGGILGGLPLSPNAYGEVMNTSAFSPRRIVNKAISQP